MDLSQLSDRQEIAQEARWNSMDTSETSSYVALKLTEIQQRFAELNDEDLAGLSIEESEQESPFIEGCNPYDRS